MAEVHRGAVAAVVAAEFPALALHWTAVPARGGRTPKELRERLRVMADRFHGAEAIAMRTKPVPHAYRVFFRHIGLDPDTVRPPYEAAVVRRLEHGGFRSEHLLADALTIATIETGVGVWALDLAAVEGVLEIRQAAEGEAHGVPGGRLVVADDRGVVAQLFAPPFPERAAARDTPELALYAVTVAGVPDIHAEEALDTAAELLE